MKELRAFAEALFSDEQGPPPAERLDWLMGELADYLRCAGPGARFVFLLSLWVVALGAPLFLWRFPALSRLSVPARVAALTRMEASFAAAPVLAVKAFLCVVYYEHPEVQRGVGHVGPATFPQVLP